MALKIVAAGEGETRVELPEVLTIEEVADAFAALKSDVVAATKLTIDAAETQRIDTAGVQLVCALIVDAGRRSVPVTWSGISTAMTDAATAIGLASVFDGV